jgi:Fe-S-cluster-containing hydrogenase component 2
MTHQTVAKAHSGRIVFQPSSCRTCRVCEVSCAILHEGQSNPAVARINIVFDEFADAEPVRGVICQQCEDAPCIEACRFDALVRDEATGAIVIDEERCKGCMLCAQACPWEVPKRHPTRRLALKCDLCYDRPQGPLCVAVCPLSGQALRYECESVEISN